QSNPHEPTFSHSRSRRCGAVHCRHRRGVGTTARAGAPMNPQEQFETRSKKVRGMARQSLELIYAMYAAARAAQPITGRGIGYKLFTAGLIPSVERANMQRVYRLLKEGREQGLIPWEWIVDETRELERIPTWDNPEEYVQAVHRSYKRDFWR